MKTQEVLAMWLAIIEVQGDRSASSSSDSEHVRIFPIDELKHAGATVVDLSEFLVKAFGAYSRRARELGLDGWFYAWVDEMSGTLRCSISAVTTVTELPFGCRIETVENVDVIAQAALRFRYTSGIPLPELKDIDWSAPEEDLSGFVLPVYVKRLVRHSEGCKRSG